MHVPLPHKPTAIAGKTCATGRAQRRANRRSEKKVADIFGSLRKRGVDVQLQTKRSAFGGKRSASIETTSTGQTIGAIGVQALQPVVHAEQLPDSLQSSMTNIDDPPHRLRKSSSASKFFDKLRGKSGGGSISKGPSFESEDEAPSALMSSSTTSRRVFGVSSSGTTGTRSTSEENVNPLNLCGLEFALAPSTSTKDVTRERKRPSFLPKQFSIG